MKKLGMLLILLVFAMNIHTPSTNAAEYDSTFCTQYKGVEKIWWEGMELKAGQIGRLNVEKDTPLFKLQGDKKVFSRTLKAGEFYRIYAFKPGMLNVGGGYYVDRDSRVTYETPSKAKKDAAYCVYVYNPAHVSFILNKNKTYVYEHPSTGGTEGFSFSHQRSDGVNFWIRDIDYNYSRVEKETTEGLYGYCGCDVGGSSALLLIKYLIKNGTKWGLGEGENQYGTREIISVNSTVTTKAGTFKNVVVIKEHISYGNITRYEYYAPNVGLIRESEQIGSKIVPWRQLSKIIN
ncbi:hypothetical protein ACLM5H_16270 [Fredinandcohnia humi]